MNLLPLANLLEMTGVATKGKDLFIDMMPAEAEQAILMRTPLTGTPIDYELPGYFHATFQLIVRTRASEYDAGSSLGEAVVSLLTLNEVQVENMYFNYCRPRTELVVFPLSKGNLLEFTAVFECCFVKS